MSVAEVLNRPLLLVWMSDLHCNCSFRSLFASPLQFAVLEDELPRANMSEAEFQVYNYMRPEEGAVKDALIQPDPARHLYFKSGFMMNHPFGSWHSAQSHIQRLVPVPAVADKLISDKGMVGLHVRNVFDAPRDATTAKVTLGKDAMREAQKEYGTQGTRMLMRWRKASHWTNFVPRIVSLLQEHGYRHPQGLEQQPLHFYLAADSQDAYGSLSQRFPSRMLFTPRGCASERCDFRDCMGMRYSLIDMMNLARTRLILGSGANWLPPQAQHAPRPSPTRARPAPPRCSQVGARIPRSQRTGVASRACQSRCSWRAEILGCSSTARRPQRQGRNPGSSTRTMSRTY